MILLVVDKEEDKIIYCAFLGSNIPVCNATILIHFKGWILAALGSVVFGSFKNRNTFTKNDGIDR
jgi:hypothetical protein